MVGWGERTRLIEISMWYSAGNRMKEGAAVGGEPQGSGRLGEREERHGKGKKKVENRGS